MIGGRLVADREARRELLELALATEVGAGRTEGNARPVEHRRAAAQIALPQNIGPARIPGIAATGRQAELIGQVEAHVAEHGIGFCVDIGLGEGGQPGHSGEDTGVELGVGAGIEIIEADHAVQPALVIEKLEFLAELFVLVIGRHVDIDSGQRIEVDRRGTVILAPGADRAQRHRVIEFGRQVHRQAVGLHILLGIDQPATGVEHIVQHRRARCLPRNQAMAATRVAVILGIVAGDAHQHRRAIAAHFEGGAAGPDILVIIVLPGGEILAEAAARQAGKGTTQAHQVADRRRHADDAIGLIIAAIAALELEREVLRQHLRDIFDRAADRVAAIERALRPAQHLDPFDVIDVEQRALRPVEIDIVEIDADALFEAGNRILLADAADEGGQRRIGAARRLQRGVGGDIGEVADVDRPAPFQIGAGEGADRDRHRHQRFLTPAGSDDDAGFFGVGGGHRRVLREGGECHRAGPGGGCEGKGTNAVMGLHRRFLS